MRTLFFLIIILIGYLGPFWLFASAAFVYAMGFRGPYELLIPAIFIDAQFGWGGALFGLQYVFGAGAAVILAEIMKPYLRFHTTLI